MPATARSKSGRRETDARRQLLGEKWLELRDRLQSLPASPELLAVHDVRVAVRSLRALLRSLRDETNPVVYAQLRFDLTNLGREFAAVRTADVHRKTLDALLTNPSDVASKDLANLKALLVRTAAAARRSLALRVLEAEWQQRLSCIDATIGGNEWLLKPIRSANDEYHAMLVVSIEASLRALRKSETGIAQLHQQRIRIKNTRYVCEALASQIDSRRMRQHLSKAQNILGDIHDLDALLHWIRRAPLPKPLARRVITQLRQRYVQRLEKYRSVRHALLKCLRGAVKRLRENDLDKSG